MGDDDARSKMEKNFHQMVDKVDKLFTYYEKRMTNEKKPKQEDNSLVNQEGGGKDPIPPSSPSSASSSLSSSSSHLTPHPKAPPKEPLKRPLLKLNLKFDLPMFNGEANTEKLNNWIRKI